MKDRVKIKGTLDINYVKMFSEKWSEILTPLLCSPYMFNLMAFLKELYDIIPNTHEGKGFVFPYQKDIFNNFRSCPYENLRVVIIGNEPYNNNNSTGIPFAMPPVTSKSVIENDLKAIEKIIRGDDNIPKWKDYAFDETMQSWTYQGVLLLDAASTSEENYKMAHGTYWRNFTREVIKTISHNNEDIVFMLWGDEAKYFEKFINRDKHHVLIGDHPQDAQTLNKEWKCSHFSQANKILEKLEGEGNGIYW